MLPQISIQKNKLGYQVTYTTDEKSKSKIIHSLDELQQTIIELKQ